MASKQPSHTTQTSEVKLPQWVDSASSKNYQLAEQIAAKPYQSYNGETVAPMTQKTRDMNASFQDQIRDVMHRDDKWYWDMKERNKAATSYQPGTVGAGKVTAGSLSGMDLSGYMNPYLNEVEANSMRALDDSRKQGLMQNADKAVAAGAFGGSRSAIVDALTNSEAAKASGDLSAKIRADGFNTATGLATQDLNRRLQADTGNADRALTAAQSNQQAGLTANAQRIQGVLADSSIANDYQKRMAGNYTMSSAISTAEQQQRQRELDDAYSRWSGEQNHDLEGLNLRLAALGMSPYGRSETTQSTSKGGSSGADWAQAGVGLISMLAGLSDETTKTDIQKVGKDKSTGLDMYSFRYKGDPKNYPKIVGPMAQDIQKKYPDQVIEVGGKLAVKNEFLERFF